MVVFTQRPMVPKEPKKVDVMKWAGWVLAVSIIIAVAIYVVSIRKQVWFTIKNPDAVNACLEGYEGEHSEADRRFRLKQNSEIISPIEDLKEQSQ